MPKCSGCKKSAGRSMVIIGDNELPYCNDCIKSWEYIFKKTKIITPIKGKPQGKIKIIRFDKDAKNK